MPNNAGVGGSAVFSNGGVPPAAAAAVLGMPPLYSQPPIGGDHAGLPGMWTPQTKLPHQDPTISDVKQVCFYFLLVGVIFFKG